MGSIMTAVSALAYGSVKDGSSDVEEDTSIVEEAVDVVFV